MKNTYGGLAGALLYFQSAAIFAVTPAQQAFIDGQAAALAATAGASTNITNGTVATTVNSFNPAYYSYSPTAPQASYFVGGNGNTSAPAASKITVCQTGPTNPDAFRQQDCTAVNLMVHNPQNRPQFTLSPTNPNVVASRIIEANPGTLAARSLGYANPSAIGAFTGCTNRTVTTPATYTTEICDEYGAGLTNWCALGTSINVNPNTNYQCNQTNNAFQTQTCSKTTIPVVTPTPYCDVAGSATGIGSYQKLVKAYYDFKTRKMIPATYVTQPYGLFDVVFACAGDALAKVTVTIAVGAQCHWGGCNSDYYPLTLNFIPGRNTATSGYQARVYDGTLWHLTSITYNGTTNTVSLSDTSNPTQKTVTATTTPTGTVGIRNVISWTLNNGCAVQEAAAL